MTTLIKISQLPSATTPLSGEEVMTVVQGGVTKKISSQAINDLLTTPVTSAQAAAEAAAAAAATSATASATSASLSAAQVTSASTQATIAATAADNAHESATLAQQWATKANDEVVIGEGYSAKQYALNAAASATSIGNSATEAAASAASATASAASALTSKNSATTSAATATTKASEASTSATNSASSASTATTKASDAATSATAAATSATNASASAATATTKAGEASTTATNAAASAASASTSETSALSSKNSASASATTATTQAGIATTKAGEASTSATNAATSASAAAASESNALSYKNTAVSSATTATTQAGIATTQAGTATTQAGIATTKAGEAATSASSASTAQAAAESARDATLAAFDSFDDRYLGAKASDPATDNDGNALQLGALYYRTQAGSEGMRVYTELGWVAAYISGNGVLSASNNLSELTSPSTARTNLGLATVAATGDYADLIGKPTLFSGEYADLTGKPSLFSGEYADLTGKPTIPTVPTTVSSFTNDAGYLTSFTETDPIFAASPAYGITSTKITNWDTSYGWGNHASAGYATYPSQTSNSGKFLTTNGSAVSWASVDALPTQTGNSGKYLTTNGTVASWGTIDLSSYLTTSAASTNYQPKDADLTAIAGLTGTSGLLKKTAADTWSLDTNTYLTGITSSQVTTALGFTPYNSTNPSGYITGINSSMVTTALGFTPYNSTNPNGYITSSGSISGNAATATSSPLLSKLADYSWSGSTTPASFNQGIQASFVDSSHGFQNYGSVMTMNTYSSGGGALQMYVPYSPTYGGTGLQVRFGNYDVNSGNSWTSWKTLLASDNYNSYSPTLTGTGASGTWGINVTGNAGTVTINYSNDSNSTYQMLWGSGNSVYGTGGIYCNPATDYLYASSFNCGNWFRSSGSTGWYNETYSVGIYATEAGNVRTYNGASFISAGNVTAYSDERLKTNWRSMPDNFINDLSTVKSGVFDRTDNKFVKTQVGVSAQSLRKVMPEAVVEDNDGMLSVAYGNAALAACVELAKRVVALEAEIKALKG